jgi:C1A family cysteine protease
MNSTTLQPRSVSRYGWTPDLPDRRDHKFQLPSRPSRLPSKVDLRPQMPSVYDQEELNSCTANAIAGILQYERLKQNLQPDFIPSRLFIYYGEREIERTISEDGGAMIRDGIKVVAKLGAPPESDWPYDVAQFARRPPDSAYADALSDRALSYARISRRLSSFRGCLAHKGPFVFGFSVYESFESTVVARSGEVPMPRSGEALLGGHAVLAIGYDDSAYRFIVRNSWGSGWGLDGYFTMPYAYLTNANLSDDFWNISLVGQQAA